MVIHPSGIHEHRIAKDVGTADGCTLPVGGGVAPPERVPQRGATTRRVDANPVIGKDRIGEEGRTYNDRTIVVAVERGVNHDSIIARCHPQPGSGVLGDDAIDQQSGAIRHLHAVAG